MKHKDTAKEFLLSGLSFLPVDTQSKRPAVKEWKQWMKTRPTDQEIEAVYANLNGVHGIALIGGIVSGNLEIIDFDNHHGNAKAALTEWSKMPEVKEILDRYPFFVETTQSGGYHIIYRHTGTPQGNQKLAMEPKPGNEGSEEDKDYDTLIETRGEGGYCIVHPTTGYERKKGDLKELPVITEDDRIVLLSYARTLCKKPIKAEKKIKLQSTTVTQLLSSPGSEKNIFEAFNNHATSADAVLALLGQHGFKFSHASNGNQYFIRPGKKKGVSLSFNGQVFYAFSSNAAPFPHEKGVNLFTAFALLAHGGDVKRAVAELSKDPRFEQYQTKRIEVVRISGDADEPSDTVVTPEGGVVTTDFFVQMDMTKTPPRRTIRYDLFTDFLTAAGFRKYREGDELLFARIQNNLVKIVEIEEIQSFVRNTIKKQVDQETLSFVMGNVKLFTPAILAYLDPLPYEFNQSTREKAWVYFKNKAVAVTRDGFDPVDYDKLEHPIWERHLLPWEWSDKILDRDGGEWLQFLRNVAGDQKTLNRLMAAIGYLMHGYKQHSLAKAIILIDAKIPTISYDANGGTGKSLIGKWIAKYRSSCIIDGRKLNKQNNLQFLFQGVEPDTQVVFIDDADPHFDFQMLFSSITSDMTIRKMYQGEFVIPFERSPKFLSTTNHSIRGTDDSTNRRKYEVGISDYYGADRNPRDEFGHDLIYDWSEAEWENSHFVMLMCLQHFLINGLVVEELDNNQKLKKAISETSIEFVNFMLEKIYSGAIYDGKEWDRKLMYNDFVNMFEESPDFKKFFMRSFTNWIEKFCRIFKLKHTERRSNSINLSMISGGINEKLPPELIKKHLKLDVTAYKAEAGGNISPF